VQCRKSMARIKYILNERRLGLLAAASPLTPSSTQIPFSASPSSDPFAGIEALRGVAEIPTWIQTGPTVPESQVEEGELEAEAGQHETVVSDAEVGKEEVESRDEGFGGGQEAKEFVNDVKVTEDGHVVKK
jgi:large subunit ribosomal protein L47